MIVMVLLHYGGRETVVSGFDPSDFIAEQVFYPSFDGTAVPMFVVRPAKAKRDGTNPCLLYGYGGFNISLPPSFSVMRLLVLQNLRGLVCVPNLR